jgi:hypothetical protein
MCDQNGPFGPGSAPCLAGITVKSSDVTVRGLTVTGAIGEGILVTGSLTGHSIGRVLIRGNRVIGNDEDGKPSKTHSPYPPCRVHGEIPGDCGEGIHLMGVYDSIVSHNRVEGNAGGILLSDELGPTYHNKVGHNFVTSNLYDCGITVPGHNPNAVSATGARQPSMGGVYGNAIVHNVVNQNGLKGEGAGILFAGAGPGTGSYDNFVGWNTANGNNLAGITVHSHAPNTDVNGNRFFGNRLSHNNRGGDPDAGLTKTADIVVFSAGDPITGTVARGNWIRDAFFGIWTLNAHTTLAHNHYRNVQHPVHQG